MKPSSLFAVLLGVRAVQLGPLRLTVYGLCATAGVVLGMALTGQMARRRRLSHEAAWDTGLLAVVSCFVASRLLLVLRDPRAFALYPFTVLALPSLTYGGLLLAGVLVLLYLWRRRLPVLGMLDVFAPGAALLATALELGHALDGSEPGMPVDFLNRSRVWDARSLHLYPVALLGVGVAGGICLLLVFMVRPLAERPGRMAAAGLVLGGAGAVGLSMLALPDDAIGVDRLEPGQIAALLMCLAGGLLWALVPPASAAGEQVDALWSDGKARKAEGQGMKAENAAAERGTR